HQYPQLLETATVQFLALPIPSRLPCSDAKTNLESALRRMLPAEQHHRLTEIYDGLKQMRTFFIEDAFAENLSDDRLETAVHAEVFLMEHFYFNNFAFVGHERYIGCSKVLDEQQLFAHAGAARQGLRQFRVCNLNLLFCPHCFGAQTT
ncbi:hypothetical protein LTS02_018278, partial [Friedmanniomyces endolithicus]